MTIEIKNIRRKDYKKAIQFAIKGMHFDWYLNNKFLLNAYGRYFLYLEMNRATKIYGAYVDDKFVGCLFAEIKGEPKVHRKWYERLYVKFVDLLQKLFFKEGAGVYDVAIKEQLNHYLETHNPGGEIIFLASNPESGIKGVGTALLNKLIEDEKGKMIYLHTDNACTYQFYEKRGFERVEEKDIVMVFPKGEVPLKCFVYSRIL